MKKFFLISLLLFSLHTYSQTYIKANATTVIVGIPNVGIETSMGKKSTFQFDILASMWKSVKGIPMQFYIFMPEYRYHFHEKYDGFYVGANMGFTKFNFSRLDHLKADQFEKGIGYLMGFTVGYEKKINDKFMLDIFLGGGNSQGFYKGYYIGTNTRYESAKDYNKSGEWIPYRGGVMVSYRIK